MIVLGINETHCATAAVLRDGRIVGCASEERFTRLKNDAGYPGGRWTRCSPISASAGRDRPRGPGRNARGLPRVAEPRAPRRGVRAAVLRGRLAVAPATPGAAGEEARPATRDRRRRPRQVRHQPGGAAWPGHRAPRARPGPHRLPRPPRVPRRRRLVRVRLRRAARARPHQRQLRGRPLRDRLHRPRARARPPRGGPERPRLPRLLLLLRDPRPRHEVRRARVQGDGAGALCRRALGEPGRGGPARRVRPGRGPARHVPLA